MAKKVKRYLALKIDKDCLVPKGAMKVESIFKDDGHFKLVEDAICKFDDAKQIMYNVMVLFNKVDSQGMILDNEDLRNQAMMDFLESGDKVLKFSHEKDDAGDSYDINARILELYIAKENDPIYPDYVGSIIRSAYFEDKEDYEIAKTLNFQSSIEGKAKLEEIDLVVEKEKKFNKIKDLLKKIFNLNIDVKKDFDTVMTDRRNNNLYEPVSVLETAIYLAYDKFHFGEIDKETFIKEVNKTLKQFTAYLNEMTFEKITKEKKGESDMERQEIETIVSDKIKDTIGIENEEALKEFIKGIIGEQKPFEFPIVKDKDGNDKSIVDAYGELLNSYNELNVKYDELIKSSNDIKDDIDKLHYVMTNNDEIPIDDNIIEKKQKRLKEENESSLGLL
jgi:hypothetical protein